MQIAQPPRQLFGWLRLQIKDIYHIYNVVEMWKGFNVIFHVL